MRYTFLILVALLLSPATGLAQDETPEELFEDGDFFYARGDYEEAAYLYRQLVTKEPGNHNARYKLGMAYLNIEGQESLAIDQFLKASENTTIKYRQNYYPMKQAPHHTWFYLGNAYRIDNQLDKALEAYETFKAHKDFEKHYNVRITNEEIKAVERAKIIQDAAVEVYAACYEEPINSGNTEYNAVISANGKVMVWLNSQKFYEAIMMSTKRNGKWSAPVNITPQVGSDGDMIPTGLSADGKVLLMARQREYDSDIYISEFDGSLWSPAKPVPGEVNSIFTELHASFYPDGSKMLVTSDRRGTLGGMDIWISSLKEDGTWSEPVNAGSVVNTETDETSAYISPDGSQLLFSSKGHFNMGGYDIFQSDVKADGTFGFPFNIGYPINTTNDNLYFVPLKDGNRGICCIRSDEGVGDKDIWYYEIIPREEQDARALTRLSEEDFTITLKDNETGEEITLHYDAVNDKVTVTSSGGKSYQIVYTREGNE